MTLFVKFLESFLHHAIRHYREIPQSSDPFIGSQLPNSFKPRMIQLVGRHRSLQDGCFLRTNRTRIERVGQLSFYQSVW